MRTSLRRMFSLGVVVLFIAQHNSNAQTITSTTSGGRWNAASTWVGGVVPSSGNDVVIAGLVKFENGDGSCRNLTVNSGGTLNNATDYYANERILTVNGNVTNNGTIANYGNQPLVLRIKGNVINNGTWTPRRAELNGTGTQTLTAGATNGFNSNITVDTIAKPSIAAGSNLIFTATFDLGKRTLDMKSYSLTFVGEGTLLTNGTVVSAKDITGLPAYSIYGTPNYPSMYNITYSGSVNIHNRIQINSLVTFSGTTTVTDTLETISDYYANERILTIIGSLTNNGIMRGGRNPLALNVSGDITNNGTWTFTRTELSGTSNQTLTLAPNKLFESAFKVTDFLGMIVAGSNLAMTSWFDLRKCTLDMKNYSLTLQGSGATVYNGLVVNTKDIVGRTVGGANPNVDNITYDGNPTIKGRFRINTLVTFKGNVTIADTIESYYYYADPEKVLKIVGNITNNGIIRNYGNGLALNVTGNVTNNGTWIHKRTDLSGTSNQVITLNPSAKFESPFRVTDSLGMVVAGSNLVFTSSFDLNKTVLDMKSFNLTLVSDGAGITNGIVINTKDVNGVPSYNIYGTPLYPMMNNITYDGSIYLKGRIQINYSATLKGNVTVVDTVESISDYYANARTLCVIGNITNTGIMRGGRNPFYLSVTGNLLASKPITNNGVQLAGSGNRTIVDQISPATYSSTGENVVLVGDNYLPSLSIAANSKCILANGSTIYTVNGLLDPALDNWSCITATRKFTGAQNYSFFRASIKVLPNAAIDSVSIQSYGHQVPTSFAGAVKSWWRVRTFAGNTKQSFSTMSFVYDHSLLGTNTELALQVYQSVDSGMTWKQVSTSTNTVRDTAANSITLTDAFGYGDYVVSSSADPSSVRPSIVVSIAGRNAIRVGGAPNRFTINYFNNSDSPTLDFLLPVMTEKSIHIKSAELPRTDGTIDYVPIDSIMYDGDDSSAVFWVAPMNPREQRSFDIIVTCDAPPVSKISGAAGVRLGKGTDVLIEPLTTIAAATVTYMITKAGVKVVCSGIDYLGKKAEELTTLPPDQMDKAKIIFSNTGAEFLPQAKKENTNISPTKMAGEKLSKILITKAMNITGGAYDIAASTIGALKRVVPNLRARLWVWIMDDVGYFGVKETTDVEISSRSLKKTNAVRSLDPNEKDGPTGFGPKNYITSAGKMAYRICFENKKDATAPAWKISIVDTLRPELDPETFAFGPTSHDSAQYNWVKTRTGNIVRWYIEGIELPPNVVPPQGEGWVSFTVNAKPNLPSGTTIKNAATIVFDMNAPIGTNEYVNTLDYLAPTTTMKSIPAKMTATKLVVKWQGVDDLNGSGVESYTVYAAKDSGAYQAIGSTTADSMVVNVDMYTHRYSFYALSKDNVGNVETKRPTPVISDITNGVEKEEGVVPTEFALYQNYPNPFNPTTQIVFSVSATVRATLKIYDMLGREIVTLIDEEKNPGRYTVKWDASKVASGVYFYRLIAGDFVQTRRLSFIK